eukprot:14892104-Alexandrium_andersonii.AAC.1
MGGVAPLLVSARFPRGSALLRLASCFPHHTPVGAAVLGSPRHAWALGPLLPERQDRRPGGCAVRAPAQSDDARSLSRR